MTGQKVSTRVKARCEPPSRGFAWRAVRERPAKEGNTARPAMELSASKTESRLVGGSRPYPDGRKAVGIAYGNETKNEV